MTKLKTYQHETLSRLLTEYLIILQTFHFKEIILCIINTKVFFYALYICETKDSFKTIQFRISKLKRLNCYLFKKKDEFLEFSNINNISNN